MLLAILLLEHNRALFFGAGWFPLTEYYVNITVVPTVKYIPKIFKEFSLFRG